MATSMTTQHTATRETQKTDRVYAVGDPESPGLVFVTPDAVGRYFFDSIEAAREDQGDDLPLVVLEHYDEDHFNCTECFPEEED